MSNEVAFIVALVFFLFWMFFMELRIRHQESRLHDLTRDFWRMKSKEYMSEDPPL